MLPTRLATARTLLRPWHVDDRPALLRHADDPAVARTLRLVPSPYDDAAASAWLAYAAASPPPEGVWAIEVGGEAVGCVGLERGPDIGRHALEVGYWLGRAVWGRGLATEVVRAVTGAAWAEPDVARVHASVFGHNVASMRVLEKAGYRREAVLARAGVKDGRAFDRVVYARTRDTGLPYAPAEAPAGGGRRRAMPNAPSPNAGA